MSPMGGFLFLTFPPVLVAGILLSFTPSSSGLSAAGDPNPASAADLSAATIIERLIEHNQHRNQRLAGYDVGRRYHLKNELYEKEALMDVEVRFRAPSELRFDTRRQEGSGFLARRVFGRIMKGEQESLQADNKRRSAMTPQNYEFCLTGKELLQGRPAYRLKVTPRREDTFLFDGNIWVDAEDFAVVRAEGQPVKRPSFWIRKLQFVRTFKKVGPFWLPERSQGVTEVLLFGTSWATIENGDYRVRLRPAAPALQP